MSNRPIILFPTALYACFCIVHYRGYNQPQCKNDINLYVWAENQHTKVSSMEALALNHYFVNVATDEIQTHHELRLFSNSCFGENININVCPCFLQYKTKFPNVNIEYTSPVSGHSFLPADRVFGRIEQDIRKINTILVSEILAKHGNEHSTDWQCFDYKASAAEFCKSQRTFRISGATY